MDRRGDRRHILDLEGERARRLHEHGSRVGPHQRGDPDSEQGIVIRRLDAVAPKHAVAQPARGLVGAVGDQEVIAGVEHREQRGRNRREPRGKERHAGAIGTFERPQRALQRLRGGRAPPSVEVTRPAGKKILRVRI